MLVSAQVLAVSAEGFDLTYTFNETDKTCTIKGYGGGEFTGTTLDLPIAVIFGSTNRYEVVGIEPHALDGIKGMKTVRIPAEYVQLGNVTAKSQNVMYMPGYSAGLFEGCPDLETIEFKGTPTFVKQTGAGILTSVDGKDVYRVMPKKKLSTSELKMSKTGVRIGAGAFDCNSTISTIVFPPALEFVGSDGGLHTMAQVTEYKLEPDGSPYRIYNHALINLRDGVLVSLPRYVLDVTKYTVDMTKTTKIGDYAFANNATIVSYTIPAGVTRIGDYAFAGSMISTAEILPYINLSGYGKGAFMGCDLLSAIKLHGSGREIPADFARDCPNLVSVEFLDGRPAGIGARAFMNCRKLSKFPVSADIQFRGDSIFANTGFTDLSYEACLWQEQEKVTKGLFAGCQDLRRINMAPVSFFHRGDRMVFQEGFAANCPKLEEVVFPNYVDLRNGSFTGDNALDKIVIADFTREGRGIFTYTGDKKYTPDVYLRVPAGHQSCWSQADDLMVFTKGATGKANMYCAGYTCMFGEDPIFYADIFMPGFCTQNYPGWYAHDKEMFSINAVGNDKGMSVECHPLLDNVVMTAVNFDKQDYKEFPAGGGAVTTDLSMKDVESFTVNYTVDGISMWTVYPASVFNTTGIEDIATCGGVRVEDGSLIIPGGGECAVYSASGVKVAGGAGEVHSLAGLARGIYVATGTQAGGKAFNIKFVL